MRYHRSNEAPRGSLSGRVEGRHFRYDWGRLLTRLRWRGDVPPFRRQLGLIELALRPGKYAVPEALPLIRLLNTAGVSPMGLAVLVHAPISATWGQ